MAASRDRLQQPIMAAGHVVVVLRKKCTLHKTEHLRKLQVFVNETFKHLEDQYACTDSTRIQIGLGTSENGTCTELDNHDDIYRRPIGDVVAKFGYSYARIKCAPYGKDLDTSPTPCSTDACCTNTQKNAFDVLMSSSKTMSSMGFPAEKIRRYEKQRKLV